MDWKHQTVLVTGAGGFIGSHLTERLVSLGAKTRAFVRYNSVGSWGWLDQCPIKQDVEIYAGDIRDADSVRRAVAGADVVFHLAALIAIPYSYDSPISYLRTNAEGTLNVLQSVRESGASMMVHTSTSEVYGSARYVPMDESHPLQAQSPYAASKTAADKLVESFHCSFGLPVTTLRPFNTYGPRQSARAVIPAIIIQALVGSRIQLGNLFPTRDFNYVADTVEAFVLAATSPNALGETINVGTGTETSIEQIATNVMNIIGRQLPVVADEQRLRPADSEVDRLCANSQKARELLGWEPVESQRQGLARTVEWIRENLQMYKIDRYAI